MPLSQWTEMIPIFDVVFRPLMTNHCCFNAQINMASKNHRRVWGKIMIHQNKGQKKAELIDSLGDVSAVFLSE